MVDICRGYRENIIKFNFKGAIKFEESGRTSETYICTR